MQLHTIGIDLGKTVFHLVGSLTLRGEVVVRKKFSSAKTTVALHCEPAGRIDLAWKPAEGRTFSGGL